jgi:urease accessory protein UreE
MSEDLKIYLQYQEEQRRIARAMSDIDRQLAIKQKEINKLEEDKSDLRYQHNENAEVLRKMEIEARKE